jgi:hypothetical protein
VTQARSDEFPVEKAHPTETIYAFGLAGPHRRIAVMSAETRDAPPKRVIARPLRHATPLAYDLKEEKSMRRSIPGLALSAILTLCPAWVMADQATANRVAEAIRASGKLTDYKIGVKFDDDGTATLLGRVSSDAQAKQAIAVTASLPYVKSVVSQLHVESGKNDGLVQPAAPQAGEEDLAAAHRQRIPHPLRGFRSPAGDPKELKRETPSVATRSGQKLAANDSNVSTVRQASSEVIQTAAPSDPLSKAQPVQFAPAATSRRFAEEPMVSAPSAPVPPSGVSVAAPMMASRQVSAAPVQLTGHHGRPRPCATCAPMGAPSMPGPSAGYGGAAYDQPHMPNHAWPSYAAYPNYAAVSYPKQYSASAWPYIGPFYPYPQVPLGWRKVSLEWDDGWWFLEFKDRHRHH